MIDTLPPPQVETRATPAAPEQNAKRTGAYGGILAVCGLLALLCLALGTRIYSKTAALAEAKAEQARSNFKAEQTQANLDVAKAQASALEAQLATDQGRISDLQAQLLQVKAQSTGLLAQVARDQGQRSDLQSQLDQAKAQLAQVQAQLTGAGRESSALRAQLDQAKGQAADLQAQLASERVEMTKLHPLIVEAHRMPLITSFEKSFWDQGFTLHIANPGSATLRLRITISGKDRTRAQVTDIEGGAALNVPSLPAGESVVIESEGFGTLNLTAR
jgi:septal ring factor EnvC (AmiA/AmiB activator)